MKFKERTSKDGTIIESKQSQSSNKQMTTDFDMECDLQLDDLDANKIIS